MWQTNCSCVRERLFAYRLPEPSSLPWHFAARHRRVMAPQYTNRGADKKLSTRAKKSRPSTFSCALFAYVRGGETMQDNEVTPIVGDEALEMEHYYDSATEDDVVGGEDLPPPDTVVEENTVSMEEFGSASVTAMIILEGKVEEGSGKEPDVKKTTPNESAGFELENEETFKKDSLFASLVKGDVLVIKEKILEDKNPIKLKEEAMPKPVNSFSKGWGLMRCPRSHNLYRCHNLSILSPVVLEIR